MQQNQKIIVAGLATLVVGLFFGYTIRGTVHRDAVDVVHAPTESSHVQHAEDSQKTSMSMSSHDSSSMHAMMMDMNAALRGKTGDEFDKAFLTEMIVHHQGAIDMAALVLQTSKRPQLRTLAQEIITAQTKEIKMMTDWQSAWFK